MGNDLVRPYFEDIVHWVDLWNILKSWRGTPYRHLWATKDRGADCALFIGAVLLEAELLTGLDKKPYPNGWFMHSTEEVLRAAFELNKKNFRVGTKLVSIGKQADLMRGDVPMFSLIKQTGVAHHAGIMLDPPDCFMHVNDKIGVSPMNWGASWQESLVDIYRIMEE